MGAVSGAAAPVPDIRWKLNQFKSIKPDEVHYADSSILLRKTVVCGKLRTRLSWAPRAPRAMGAVWGAAAPVPEIMHGNSLNQINLAITVKSL